MMFKLLKLGIPYDDIHKLNKEEITYILAFAAAIADREAQQT